MEARDTRTQTTLSESLNDPLAQIDMLNNQQLSPYWKMCYELVMIMVPRAIARIGLQQIGMIEEEVAQEVMLKVKLKLSTFRGNSRFTTWLFTIVYNEIVDEGRRRKRSVSSISIEALKEAAAMNSDDGTESFDFPDPTEQLEEKCVHREMIEEIIHQTYSLKHPQYKRNCIILQLWLEKGLDCKTIAKEMDVKKNVIYGVLAYAKKHLIDRIKKEQ